jgi:hypothetical protein
MQKAELILVKLNQKSKTKMARRVTALPSTGMPSPRTDAYSSSVIRSW